MRTGHLRWLTDEDDAGSASVGRKRSERDADLGIDRVVSYVAAVWWVDALEPAAQPALTVELNPGWILFGLSLVVGTFRGVRVAWAILVVGNAVFVAAVPVGAFQDGGVQAIGGSVLAGIALVCSGAPSTQRFERRRLRAVFE